VSLTTLIADTRKAVADDGANAQAVFSAQGTLAGVTEVDIRTGAHTFKVDEPPALGGADVAANPVQYALASLGSCQAITYRFWAEQLGISFDSLTVRAEGDLDIRGFLGFDGTARSARRPRGSHGHPDRGHQPGSGDRPGRGGQPGAAAARAGRGADLAGGTPALDDEPGRAIESLAIVAADARAGLDLHIDETAGPAVLTLPHLVAIAEAGFGHPVTASYAVRLRTQTPEREQVTAQSLARAGIGVVTLPQACVFSQQAGA
jgi:hypothetical protein